MKKKEKEKMNVKKLEINFIILFEANLIITVVGIIVAVLE